MMIGRYKLSLAVAVLAFSVGHEARAQLDISNAPLFLVTPVKPALIMALDDSVQRRFCVVAYRRRVVYRTGRRS